MDAVYADTGTSLGQYGVYLRREKVCGAKHYLDLAHQTEPRRRKAELNDTHDRIVLLEENLRALSLLGPSQSRYCKTIEFAHC